MFKKVCIIGCGLIGSSISRAIKKNKLAGKIVSSNRSDVTNKKIITLNVVDEASSDTKKMVQGSDLVIIATPLSSYKDVILKIKSSLKNGAILTDVGSVKKKIISLIENKIPKNISWISSHPIAGTENSGPEAGFASLFEGRWCVITPTDDTSESAIDQVTNLWRRVGSKVDIMTPAHHDKVLAITSHIPHLIAFNIVGTVADLEDDTKMEAVKYAAGGFRDFTRIAASDPEMWRDVFMENREAVLEMLGRFNEDLSSFQKAIRNNDLKFLESKFSKSKEIRKLIEDLGQAGTFDPTESKKSRY